MEEPLIDFIQKYVHEHEAEYEEWLKEQNQQEEPEEKVS